ncbi:MAG: hypothetical protein J6Y02_00970 [Pseudobutyrivibrio sp.]|nr:hypothetical protein [Pseudobutyrivibrio sp.]
MLKKDGLKLYMTRGDSARIQAVPKVKDEETGERVPYELVEGDQIIFRLKRKAEDGIQVHCEKSADIDLENNKAILSLVPEDTQTCEFKEYRYEFELITFDDFHSTFIENQPFTIGKELETHG